MKKNNFISILNDFINQLQQIDLGEYFNNHIINNYKNKMHNFIMWKNFNIFENDIKKAKNILDFGWGTVPSGSFIIRKINSTAKINALETLVQADPNYKEHEDKGFLENQKKICNFFGEKYNIVFDFYDGNKIPYENESFDLIFAYAVIEHIDPENRKNIMKEFYRILKPNGKILIARLPRYFSITEFLARKLKLGAHTWVLKKEDIKKLSEGLFNIDYIHRVDSCFVYPTSVTNKLFPLLSFLDNCFTKSKINFWAHDYTLSLTKKNEK